MMRVAVSSADPPPTCLLCAHPINHSLTHGVATRLQPLFAKCSPLARWLSPFVLPHYRNSSRLIIILILASFLMIILMSYSSPSHRGFAAWLPMFGTGRESAKNVCTLLCPRLAPTDLTWRARALPLEYACQPSADLPIPCRPNDTSSHLLQLPPISFLKNYLNPCWFEPTTAKYPDPNPYSHNLYACFSRGALATFKEMAEQNYVRPRRMRCLPYAYIGGMPKSGSTDLYRKVILHPHVAMPPIKEPHWWGKNRFGQRLWYTSSIPFKDYVDLFDRAALHIESRPLIFGDAIATTDDVTSNHLKAAFHPVITVDASASTFWNNDEWWRLPENCGRLEPLFTNAHYIRRLTPQARIIVILRNPTDRLYSDYLYFTKTNKSVSAFHQDVLLSIEQLHQCAATRSLRSCVYDKRVASGKTKVRLRLGLYHVYLLEWLKVFPREQLLVLRTEDYSKDLLHTTRQIYQFLGLRALTEEEEEQMIDLPIANTRKLSDKKLGPMWKQTRQALQEFYRAHNQRLAELLQDPRFLWDDVINASDVQERGRAMVDERPGAAEFAANGERSLGIANEFIVRPSARETKGPSSTDIKDGFHNGGRIQEDITLADNMAEAVVDDFPEQIRQGTGDESGGDDEDNIEDSGYSYSDSGYNYAEDDE